jgi:hypothetical protein
MVNESGKPLFKFRNKQRRLPPTPAFRLGNPRYIGPARISGTPGIDGKEFFVAIRLP